VARRDQPGSEFYPGRVAGISYAPAPVNPP
jgi:hypothetical protein